ncbi:MAG: hypothetical protein AAF700_10070 [Pseudomonadota bacterium]
MKTLCAVTLISVLAACAQPAVAVKTVREADAAAVATCEQLGRVAGIPGVFGPFAQLGLKDARNAAKRAALEQGATDIVFDPVDPNEAQYRVSGTAYRC